VARALLARRTLTSAEIRKAEGGRRSDLARDLLAKSEVRYADASAMRTERCATCTTFLPPGSCTSVRGAISPRGWCARYYPESEVRTGVQRRERNVGAERAV
jgi:hypothetical protein